MPYVAVRASHQFEQNEVQSRYHLFSGGGSHLCFLVLNNYCFIAFLLAFLLSYQLLNYINRIKRKFNDNTCKIIRIRLN